MNRWRNIYRSARTLLSRATQPIESGLLTVGSDEYKKHKRHQDQANRQLNLLRNDVRLIWSARNVQSSIPTAISLPKASCQATISRDCPSGFSCLRAIPRANSSLGRALSPFANSARATSSTTTAANTGSRNSSCRMPSLLSPKPKSVPRAGYFLTGEQKDLEICPFSGVSLGDNANKEYLHDLLEMSESRAEEVDRISCEEEERVSSGYEVSTYFAVDGGDFDSIRKASAHSSRNAPPQSPLHSRRPPVPRQFAMALATNRRLPPRPHLRRLAPFHAGTQRQCSRGVSSR